MGKISENAVVRYCGNGAHRHSNAVVLGFKVGGNTEGVHALHAPSKATNKTNAVVKCKPKR